jgi:large subunit ribosomal protein L21
MYAILQQSGHQYRVSPGDRLLVDRLAAEVGSVVALEPVVLVQGDAGSPTVGTPVVDGVRVAATVVSHPKGGKIRVFKYKAKKRYRRTHGHRSLLTELRVEAVLAAGEALPEPKVAAAEAPAKPARTRSKAKAAPVAEVETPEEAPITSDTTKARTRSRAKAPSADAPEATSADVAETPSADVSETPSAETGAQGATPVDAAPEMETPKRRTRAKKADAEAPSPEKPDTEPEA